MQEILSYYPLYGCRGATSGEEALAILKAYFSEIILLDVMMPGIDGYEVLNKSGVRMSKSFQKKL